MGNLPGAWSDQAQVWAFRAAWRVVRWLPERLAYRLFDAAADQVTARGLARETSGIARLRRNYQRIRPELTDSALDELTREGARRYFRYFGEAFRLPGLDRAAIDARVRIEGDAKLRAHLRKGQPAILLLGHLGNWDLAAAWAPAHLGHVVTIAERLKPEALFVEFLEFRRKRGLTIIPHDGAGSPLALVSQEMSARAGQAVLVPLLADRDLSASGVAVDLAGQPASFAAGPAVLALEHQAPLFVASIRHEVGTCTPWRTVVTVQGPVQRPDPQAPRREQVVALTQAAADLLSPVLREYTADWHMMQSVFLADLKPRT